MSIKLPRLVSAVLAVLGVLLFLLSVYLETAHLDLLGQHPIMVNLLSGCVGFCFGILALSVVLHGLLQRIELANVRAELTRECASCADRLDGLQQRLQFLYPKSTRQRELVKQFRNQSADLAGAIQRFPQRSVLAPDMRLFISGWLETAELLRKDKLILDRPGFQEEIQACRDAAVRAFPSGTPQQMIAVIGQLQDLARHVAISRDSTSIGDVIFEAVNRVIPLRN